MAQLVEDKLVFDDVALKIMEAISSISEKEYLLVIKEMAAEEYRVGKRELGDGSDFMATMLQRKIKFDGAKRSAVLLNKKR